MIEIIDNCAYERKPASTYTVRATEFENGHFEITCTQDTYLEEQDWSQLSIDNFLVARDRDRQERAVEFAETCARSAARRAQRKVRFTCKAMGVSTMCTLTYRACEIDLAQVKRDLKEFNRRVLQVWPGFRFVAAFERQERGAWHVHFGCPSIPQMLCPRGKAIKVRSYVLLRAIWLSVTKDRGGNFDAQRRKQCARKGPASIAAYISKYMLKSYGEGLRNTNRYATYGPVELPKSVNLGTVSDLTSAVHVCYSLGLSYGDVRTARILRDGAAFYLDIEPCGA